MPRHICKICCREYQCCWCNDKDSKVIACMNLPPRVYPRLEHFHFICSKNCMNHLVDNWKIIDQTANLDISFGDLERSIARNKKRKLNDEPITREENMREQMGFHESNMPPALPWSSLPSAVFDSSTFFARLRDQQMFVPQDNQSGPFSLGK